MKTQKKQNNASSLKRR